MTALNRGIAQRITSLEMNQRELKDSLVTAWAALQQNETALALLKEAVKASLTGTQPEAKEQVFQNPLHKVVSENGRTATAQG